MAVISMLLSGIAAGARVMDPESQFTQILDSASSYLPGRTLALIAVTLGHTAFGLHFLLMLLRIGQPAGQPTLFSPVGEEAHH